MRPAMTLSMMKPNIPPTNMDVLSSTMQILSTVSLPTHHTYQCQLLQRRGTEDYYRQIATSVERCGTCCQRHPEVWSWPVTNYAYRASLAGRSWMNTTNSVCSCTDASTTKLLGTWWTTAHQYPTLLIVNGYILPVVMKSLFHGTGSVSTDVGHLPLLARLSGTLCPRTCGIQRFLRTLTGSHWRRFYFRSTSVFSALEVFLRECAI